MKSISSFFCLLIILLFSQLSFSQAEVKSVYSAGMLFYQPGYTSTTNKFQNIKGNSNSIGGIIRLYFYDYFTTGIYGGSQKTLYKSKNSNNSFISIGYGGAFAGLSTKKNKFRYTLSAFVGMGSFKNLHIENQNNNTLTESYLYKCSAYLYSPILSLDYSITSRILATIQATYLVAKYDNKTLNNPTFQVGILFNR